MSAPRDSRPGRGDPSPAPPAGGSAGERVAAAASAVERARARSVAWLASLQTRLVAATGLLIVALVASVVALWVSSQRETLRADMRHRARTLAGTIAGSSANELFDKNWAQLQITLEMLADLDGDLVYVLVTDRREEDMVVAAVPQQYTGAFYPDLVRKGETDAALTAAAGLAAAAGRVSSEDAAKQIRLAETRLLAPVAWRGEDRGAPGDLVIEASTPFTIAGAAEPFGTLRIGVSERPVDRAIAGALRQALLLGAAALGVGLLASLLLARRITRPVLDLAISAERIRAGDLDVQVPQRAAAGGDEIALLGRTMGEMVHGLRDRDFIRDVFGRYVTPELAGELLQSKDALKLGGHLKRVTMLMSDLRGFTTLSARVGPEGMVRLLNEYLGRMSGVILSERGSINEFIGDAIFALFGAPIAREDDPLRACRCAIAMQLALEELNRENAARGLPELAMGIGINTGEVVAGNIGSEHRVKYGVVGDAVNMTSRIEGMTVGSQVLISEECWRAVEAHVTVEGPREARVKGKAEPVRTYELRAVRAVGDAPPIAMPERAAERIAEVALEAKLFLIHGKEVAAEPVLATVRRLGPRTVSADAAAHVPPLENAKLLVQWPDGAWSGDIYAKTGECSEITGVHVKGAASRRAHRAALTITALEEADRARIEGLAGDDGGPAKTLRMLPKA